MHFQFFVDFDGTIARDDVGHTFFTTFGANESAYLEIEKAWLNDAVSSADLYRAACPHIQVTPAQFEAFLEKQHIDPSFLTFFKYARSHNESMLVLSDGFHNYIEPILRAAGLSKLEICANAFDFVDDGTIAPSFPYEAFTCGKCANCKRYHVQSRREAGLTSVFIGDGKSDCCGAVECDVIFAKKDLEKFCVDEKLDYFPFRDFHDVIRNLEIIRNRA